MALLTETEYFDFSASLSPLRIQMHLDAMDGIIRDVRENPGTEVGGLLLGAVEKGVQPRARIERFQRVPFEGSFNYPALEDAAEASLRGSDLSVVGVYRSHLHSGFQPEAADFETADRYFNDPLDLILLIKPEAESELVAQFFVNGTNSALRAAGPLFPFHGRAVKAITIGNVASSGSGNSTQERPRRLVPDFIPGVVEPARTRRDAEQQVPEPAPETPVPDGPVAGLKKWWPLAAAVALVAGIFLLLVPAGRHADAKAPNTVAEAARPLGLTVEPAGKTWSISWNPNATALREAQSVQLFVREGGRDGDDQKRIELTPRDLSAGTYLYQPNGNDVTFRLEVTESTGSIAAESFRLLRTPAPVPATPVPTTHTIAPRAIHRAPPVVPASIRPRIKGKIPIDVRVQIDEHGRVTSAAPVVRHSTGLDAYLAGRAVEAAREWRFEPAREDGKAVAGEQTIHFLFEK